MAKKKVIKEGELPDIMDMMSAVDDKTEILADSQNAVIEDWIGTGNYLLNACISGSILKGIPSGKITCYYGQSGSGKSFLSCATCAQAIKKGYTILYLDSEGSITKEFIERICGTGTSKHVLIRPVETVTEVTQIITNLLNKLAEEKEEYGKCHKMMIVLDSLGNLSDDSELESAEKGETKANLQKNKLIKNLYRIVTPKCSLCQVPFITISHSYASMSMFSPGNIISGGCLVPESEIMTFNGEFYVPKKIADINVGDNVLSHDGKYHKVLKTWSFVKPTYKLSFNNGSQIECSDTHRFLVDIEKADIDDGWILSKKLNIGDMIYTITTDGTYNRIVVTQIEKCESSNVCDLTVEDTHSYVSVNGIINHNSGIQYNASVMLELFPSKLVDKENDEAASKTKGSESNVKNGITVTAKCSKNRFARPKKISISIPFYKALNPYLGLEQYMTWENSGVCRGSMLTSKEFEKLGGESSTVHSWEFNGETLYCQQKDTARGIVVKHLGKQVSFTEFFTPEVFTDEILQKLDEEVIKPEFELPSQDSYEDIQDLEDSFDVGSEIVENED